MDSGLALSPRVQACARGFLNGPSHDSDEQSEVKATNKMPPNPHRTSENIIRVSENVLEHEAMKGVQNSPPKWFPSVAVLTR